MMDVCYVLSVRMRWDDGCVLCALLTPTQDGMMDVCCVVCAAVVACVLCALIKGSRDGIEYVYYTMDDYAPLYGMVQGACICLMCAIEGSEWDDYALDTSGTYIYIWKKMMLRPKRC